MRIHLDGRAYGLEVTRIARDGPKEIAQVHWRRVVERTARLLRRERGSPPLWVSLRWNANPPQADAQKVAGLLVELVGQRLSTIPARIHVMTDIEPNTVPDELAHYVHGLVVVRTRNDDHWVSGFVNYPDVTPQELQQEIDRKTSLVTGYSTDSDGQSLLIYAEATNAAQALDMSDAARSAEYVSPFDRVFFLDCIERAAQLRMRKPSEHRLAP